MKKHVVLLITLAALHFISTSFHAYGQASPVTCVVISNPPETQVVSDYAVTVSPSYVKVMPGSTTTFEITVSSESKISDVISLGIVGLPDGINAVFDPARGTPNFTSKLTVSVDEMICPGTYRPAIIAQNTGMELVDFKLEVDNAASVRKAMETQIADLHSRIDELERAIREDKEANTGYITITLTAMIGSFLLAAFALYVLYRQQKKSDSDFRVQELLDRLRQLIEISKQESNVQTKNRAEEVTTKAAEHDIGDVWYAHCPICGLRTEHIRDYEGVRCTRCGNPSKLG
ncbi:MAG: hypothetical protein QXN83_00295 [Nitrososphaerales archaeon]